MRGIAAALPKRDPCADMTERNANCFTRLDAISQAHVESYDAFIQYGLSRVVRNFEPLSISMNSLDSLTFQLQDIKIGKPTATCPDARYTTCTTPKECRENATTYTAPISVVLSWSLNGSSTRTFPPFKLCDVPIMVGSQLCSLRGANEETLLKLGEEKHELGGYFIIGGIERVIRLLIQQRRHYVMALRRGSFCSRGTRFTEYATTIRCVDECERSSTVRAHYLSDGSISVALTLGRQEIFLPVALVLRALSDLSDYELQQRVLRGVVAAGKVELGYAQESLEKIFYESSRATTRADSLEFIGSMFSTNFNIQTATSLEIGEHILSRCLFVHLRASGAKLDLLVFMVNKLLSLVSGNCKEDNPDSLVHQEVLLPGFLIQNVLHEKLNEAMVRIKVDLDKSLLAVSHGSFVDCLEHAVVSSMRRVDIGRQLEYFLATGNLISKSGLGLSQTSGFTIVAEKLNYLRYISHFRSIHRGAYFAELRTTTVRKLLPESWGFLCPVHTPDGSPCGLLNHMTLSCQVSTGLCSFTQSSDTLISLIRESILSRCVLMHLEDASDVPVIPVLVDGIVLGYIANGDIWEAEAAIRHQKITSAIMKELEIGLLPDSEISGAYPCLAIFSTSSRLMRPVHNNDAGCPEMIGTMEQNNIRISLLMDDAIFDRQRARYSELTPCHILSIVASLTPWSDFNQSPRNMYRCQMAKQTMGIPSHCFLNRSDTKLYRLHTPQRPIALTTKYDECDIDSYPLGTNAVVAVLSHTGYDMEDAMIVNKSAVERGFAHARLYKTEVLQTRPSELFQQPSRVRGSQDLHLDGLPNIGQRLKPSEVLYSAFDSVSGSFRQLKLKGTDECVIDKVKRFGCDKGGEAEKVSITFRYDRNPVIGDKFSSRHGQKGVLSFLWPDEALPYVERSGVRPDVLINPHAFPSRMTIGMLVESLASKAGTLMGMFIDASPFQAQTQNPLDVHGNYLRTLGYNHTGTETMVNGLTGETFEVDIYIGLVYYQRLRHMVSDKFQVRSTGPVNSLTKQPVKGRKSGGGVRFGEMERDSLLAHGAAYLLRDRLHTSSDAHLCSVCTVCGSLISTISGAKTTENLKTSTHLTQCQICETKDSIDSVALPYVFKYLVAELAAMNIQLKVSMT